MGNAGNESSLNQPKGNFSFLIRPFDFISQCRRGTREDGCPLGIRLSSSRNEEIRPRSQFWKGTSWKDEPLYSVAVPRDGKTPAWFRPN